MQDFKMIFFLSLPYKGFLEEDNRREYHRLIVSYLLDFCRMESTRLSQWLKLNLLVFVLVLLKAEAAYVPISYVHNAVIKGAG